MGKNPILCLRLKLGRFCNKAPGDEHDAGGQERRLHTTLGKGEAAGNDSESRDAGAEPDTYRYRTKYQELGKGQEQRWRQTESGTWTEPKAECGALTEEMTKEANTTAA